MIPRYQVLDIDLTANQRVTLPIQAQFWACLESTGDFSLFVDGQGGGRFSKGMQFNAGIGSTFNSVDLLDLSGAANSIRLAYGAGDFRDGRLIVPDGVVVTVSAAGTIGTFADVTLVDSVVTQIRPANATRKLLAVSNFAGSPSIRIGDANIVTGVGGRGLEMPGGATWWMQTTGAVYGLVTGDDWNVAVAEIE
jgi:hypothetical protein